MKHLVAFALLLSVPAMLLGHRDDISQRLPDREQGASDLQNR